MTRQLARIVRVDAIRPIEGADAIEAAVVGGWTIVTKKGDFQPGDPAVYFEIDSFLPQGNPSWQFLVDKSARVYEGQTGHVLRSMRMRGQVSQGLLLGMQSLQGSSLPPEALVPGLDVTQLLGVQKYEPPIPAELAGLARGLFPSRVPKTDQERIQNLAYELAQWQAAGDAQELTWEVTEKLEGASCTYAWLDGELHVCSRNIDLLETEGNSLWLLARKLDIEDKLRALFGTRNVALQGELVGFGIQDNIYKMNGQRFFLYDTYDVDGARYYRSGERRDLAKEMGIDHVPILAEQFVLGSQHTMEALLVKADGESTLRKGQLREGEVYKAIEKPVSFKVVSNQYLLKQKH